MNDEDRLREAESEEIEFNEIDEDCEESQESETEENIPETVSETVDAEEVSEEAEEPEPSQEASEDVKNETKNESGSEFLKRKSKEKVKEKVYDPDSFVNRFKRNWLITFRGYKILRTLKDDPITGGVIRESTLVKRSELPVQALPCTGEKGVYCLDTIKNQSWYLRSRAEWMMGKDPCELQFTASDADLFMQSNAIDNAFDIKWTEWNHVDIKRYIMIAGIGICAIILFFLLR